MDSRLQSVQKADGQSAVVSADRQVDSQLQSVQKADEPSDSQPQCSRAGALTSSAWLRVEVHILSAAFGSFGPGPCVECSGDVCLLPPCGNKLEMHAHLNGFTKRLAVELSVVKCQMRATDCNCLRVQTASRTGRGRPQRTCHQRLRLFQEGSRCCPQLQQNPKGRMVFNKERRCSSDKKCFRMLGLHT